jgi:hypothetical protein
MENSLTYSMYVGIIINVSYKIETEKMKDTLNKLLSSSSLHALNN